MGGDSSTGGRVTGRACTVMWKVYGDVVVLRELRSLSVAVRVYCVLLFASVGEPVIVPPGAGVHEKMSSFVLTTIGRPSINKTVRQGPRKIVSVNRWSASGRLRKLNAYAVSHHVGYIDGRGGLRTQVPSVPRQFQLPREGRQPGLPQREGLWAATRKQKCLRRIREACGRQGPVPAASLNIRRNRV